MVGAGIHETVVSEHLAISIQYIHPAFGNLQGLFDRLRQARPALVVIHYPIGYDLDSVPVIFVELGKFIECIDHTVDAHPGETSPLILLRDMLECAFFVDDNRRQDHEFCFFRQTGNQINDIGGCLPDHLLAVDRTMRDANTRK